MSNYVPLDEAAKLLGVSPEELVEMRSRGEIFGYRDGASWKFKPEEIERVQQEMEGGESSSAGSDVALVADPSSDSGVRLVTKTPGKNADSDVLTFSDDSGDDLKISDDHVLSAGSSGSEIDIGDDLKLSSGSGSEISLSDVIGSGIGMSPVKSSDIHTGSDDKIANAKPGSSGSLDLDGDLQLADDASDDLVLGSGSDLALATDSGINLMSPSDSGLSLEDEPLDLAGTGISGLDLAGEGSGVGSGAGSGSLVDFQQDEEFQLSASGGVEADEDSGSQVIELEDSSDFGSAPVALPGDMGGFGDDMGAMADASGNEGLGFDPVGAAAGGAAMRGTPEVPYETWQVGVLLAILILFGISGIFVTDIVRNMWHWNKQDTTDVTTGFTQMVIDAAGMK